MSYWRCHYHLIWTTKNRMSAITPDREHIVGRCIKSLSLEHGIRVHAVGMVEDHVHVALSIPPRHAVADIVQSIKGLSSREIRKHAAGTDDGWPGWQSEYGVLTFGEQSLDRIVSYVRNQRAHHADGSEWKYLEQLREIPTSNTSTEIDANVPERDISN
ncbi:MAG TPA: IS200/IS605 family transposase [Thermomicrobiales bacterium]|nr:IS200/IS605 family transposase [Thermomicrobiales bacterium]HRA48606.1 IS200/IS605 family transposase [Thermomicrobiales bacterium]